MSARRVSLLASLALLGCNIVLPYPQPVPEISSLMGGSDGLCTDGDDNDLDGRLDCADPGCLAEPRCQVVAGETLLSQCRDGIDNDADGRFDGDDPGCFRVLDARIDRCTRAARGTLVLEPAVFDVPESVIAIADDGLGAGIELSGPARVASLPTELELDAHLVLRAGGRLAIAVEPAHEGGFVAAGGVAASVEDGLITLDDDAGRHTADLDLTGIDRVQMSFVYRLVEDGPAAYTEVQISVADEESGTVVGAITGEAMPPQGTLDLRLDGTSVELRQPVLSTGTDDPAACALPFARAGALGPIVAVSAAPDTRVAPVACVVLTRCGGLGAHAIHVESEMGTEVAIDGAGVPPPIPGSALVAGGVGWHEGKWILAAFARSAGTRLVLLSSDDCARWSLLEETGIAGPILPANACASDRPVHVPSVVSTTDRGLEIWWTEPATTSNGITLLRAREVDGKWELGRMPEPELPPGAVAPLSITAAGHELVAVFSARTELGSQLRMAVADPSFVLRAIEVDAQATRYLPTTVFGTIPSFERASGVFAGALAYSPLLPAGERYRVYYAADTPQRERVAVVGRMVTPIVASDDDDSGFLFPDAGVGDDDDGFDFDAGF